MFMGSIESLKNRQKLEWKYFTKNKIGAKQ